MLTRRAPLVALVAVLIGIGTTGCVAPTPTPSPSVDAASPSPSPLFASDEEALAAATEAYAAYQTALDRGLSTWETSDLSKHSTGDALDSALKDVDDYRAAQKKQVGSVQVSQESLVSTSLSEEVSVQMYVCVNVSNVDVIDRDGASTVSPDRPSMYPFVTTLIQSKSTGALVVAEDMIWRGDNFCE